MADMAEKMEVWWEREVPGTPQQVWDAITLRRDARLREIEHEPRLGGRERGLTRVGGAVTAPGGTPDVLRALGLGDDLAVGDRVRLAPAGTAPIVGATDHLAPAFFGVRSADAGYRFHCRREWGRPVAVDHLHGAGVDEAASEQAWSAWLHGVFTSEEVA